MFENNRFICLINNCLIDEDCAFNENYQTIKKSKFETHQLDKHKIGENEFFATFIENLVRVKLFTFGFTRFKISLPKNIEL